MHTFCISICIEEVCNLLLAPLSLPVPTPFLCSLQEKKMPKTSYLYSRQFISSGSLLNLSSTIPPKLLKVINDIWLHPVVNAQCSSHLTCQSHLAWLFNIVLSLFTFSTWLPRNHSFFVFLSPAGCFFEVPCTCASSSTHLLHPPLTHDLRMSLIAPGTLCP